MADLAEAMKNGESLHVFQMAQGENINSKDGEGWTALTSAAADGELDIIELLLESKADINFPNQWGETALSRAIFGGHMGAARLLLDRGAAINFADEDGDTPLHVAVISRYRNLELMRLLLERGADVEVKNKDGMVALDIARKYGLKDFITVLQGYCKTPEKTRTVAQGFGAWVSYLIGGAPVISEQEKETSSEDVKKYSFDHSEPEQNVTTLLPTLLELCAGMAETQDICEDILERLQRIQYLIDEQPDTSRALNDSFQWIISRFHAFLVQHSKQASVGRLASTRTILGLLRSFHCDLDEVVAQIGSKLVMPIHTHWKEHWDDIVLAVENRLVNAWEANSSELSQELPDTASQTGALLLLNSEAIRHKSRYSVRSQDLLESASKKVARMSGAPIPEIPEWFVPRHEVQREAKPFASGSYGKVYRGVWRGSKVVIKCVTVSTPTQKKAFLREARIWHKARHPHIVNFFGACYDNQPCFFICEEAANGNLADYLNKRKTAGRTLVWRKLLEGALGLGFLHQNNIVHGDLKCNQILVGGDGVAKLTDFGLSFVSTGPMPNGSGGAIRWRAPECLGSKPTFESDVYSFGMCVVEAVTYDVPWGVYIPDIAVMDHLQHRKFLSRPKQFTNDAEWEFVLALCAFDPAKRIKLEDAIKQLQRLAEELSISSKPMLAMSTAKHMRRLSKKEYLEEMRLSQLHQFQAKVFYAVLGLTTRKRYLRLRHAVLTIQVGFRYKRQLQYRQQSKALELQRSNAETILCFLRMVCERKKYLRVMCAVRVLQCRFRYHRLLQKEAKLPVEYGSFPHNPMIPEIHSTQSSWLTSTTVPQDPSQTPSIQQSAVRPTKVSNRSQWVNDEDRFNCFVCTKAFTVFRRKHHCRVCFEIICHNCSLTRKKMRVCVVCAGLRLAIHPSSLISSSPLGDGKDGFFHKTGDFLTGIGTLFRTKKHETRPITINEDATFSSQVQATACYNISSPYGEIDLWKDEDIVAVRIPRNTVTVQGIISRGGFGEVHLGTWNDMQVAVKTLLPESRRNISMINQFLTEAKLLATMEHPCIVNLIGVAWDSLADVCIVVEYMGGGDLRALLDRYERTQHPVGIDISKLRIAMNVCEGLTYMHSLAPLLIHRDLKSRNILLDNEMKAKLTDFGASRERVDETMTAGVGTALWMAPEILMGERYNEKTDIFSFGIVLSELDTHAVPYSKTNLSDLQIIQMVVTGQLRAEFSQAVPESLAELGNACISLDPTERPTAAEAMYKLQCILRELN